MATKYRIFRPFIKLLCLRIHLFIGALFIPNFRDILKQKAIHKIILFLHGTYTRISYEDIVPHGIIFTMFIILYFLIGIPLFVDASTDLYESSVELLVYLIMIAKTKITENLRVLNSVHFVMFVGTVSILFASIVVVIIYNGVIVGNTLLNSYSYTPSTENSNAAHPLIKGNPAKWTCEDVSQWFTDAGYPELAKKLLDQEFDGEAIMLLKREHFISLIYRNEETNFFGLKLGPALEVHALIEELKKASQQMSQRVPN